MTRFTTLGLVFAIALLGCAPSEVNTTYATTIEMPRPDRVLIYDFAVAPDEVHLDRGVVGKIEAYASQEPRTALERSVGHEVAKKLAIELAKRITALGIPAQRAWGFPRPPGTSSWSKARSSPSTRATRPSAS